MMAIYRLSVATCLNAALSLGLMAKDGFSQDLEKCNVTITVKNSTITRIFKIIESQTVYKFSYNKQVENIDSITIRAENTSLLKVLQQLEQMASITYKQINNMIVVVAGPEKSVSQKISAIELTPNTGLNDLPGSLHLKFVMLPIKGKITDENGQPLPGVNILEKGTDNGTITDIDGNFSISVADNNSILVISSISYISQELKVENQAIINISMLPDVRKLEEIVVVGYGTQKKKEITGSIVSVGSDKIETRPVSTFENALQGRVPGLDIITRDATPGAASTLVLRGIGSMSAGYSPLFVVDGFPTDQQTAVAINPSDIKSVDVLKDASATAIYGSRGSNGVIIITTKSAKEGRAQMNLNYSTGFAQANMNDLEDVAHSAEYVQYYKEFYQQTGQAIPASITNWDGKTDTRWQELIYRTAGYNNLSLAADGGNDKVSYVLSGNYIRQEGIIMGSDFKKFSAHLKIDYRPLKEVTVGLNLAPNFTTSGRSDPSNTAHLAFMANVLPPILPVKRRDGSYAQTIDSFPNGTNFPNPLYLVENYHNSTNASYSLYNFYVQVEPIEGLTLKSTLGANVGYTRNNVYYSKNETSTISFFPNQTTLDNSYSEYISWVNENTLTYQKLFQYDHSLTVLAGYTAQKNTFNSLKGGISNFPILGPQTFDFGTFANRSVSNGVSGSSIVSLIGRVTYSFRDKYNLTGTLRRDGSSKFGINNKYHTFPSLGVGWVLSNEGFMKNIEVVNFAKIRASYGSSGSDQITDFASLQSLAASNAAFNGSPVNGVRNSAPGNPSLTWETSKQLDIGVDLTAFKNRVDLTIDYYDRLTDGLILQANLPLSSGYAGYLTNAGSMQNRGIEVSASLDVIKKGNLQWQVGGNVTYNKQKILKLANDQTSISNFWGAVRNEPGYPLQEIYAVNISGIVKPGEKLDYQPNAQPGDFKFQDTNNDGQLSDFLGSDAIRLGSPIVPANYSVNTTLSYKNFELSTIWQGQSGGKIQNLYLIQNCGSALAPANFSLKKFYNGRYIDAANQGDGITPRAAGIQKSGAGQGAVSSFGVEKTDFLRIRNISLAYTFMPGFVKKLHLQKLRVYISADNVYTFKEFIGANPSATGFVGAGQGLIGGSRLSGVAEPYELGVSTASSTGIPRTVAFGINLTL